jgi:hypothetical protein
MPKTFQAKTIYRTLIDDVPIRMHQWMCSDIDPSEFDRLYMSKKIKHALLYQYPILRRIKDGLVPWSPDDYVPVMSLQEMWGKISENDRPQPMTKGVIENGTLECCGENEEGW